MLQPFFLTKPLFGRHPVVTAALSPGKVSLFFPPSLPAHYTNGLEATVCFLDFLPTHGCGGNLDVLKHSHSPCSCSPLEDRGRLSFVSHPVRRNAFTQGRTPRSEHEELLCMESSSNSKEQGTLEAGCKLENHLWYWTTSLSKPNQTTPSTLKV